LGERKLVLANDAALILIKVDSNGVEHWHRTYDTPIYDDYVSDFEKITDDSFLIGETYVNQSVTPIYIKGKAFTIDSLGNIYWTNVFNGNKEEGGVYAWSCSQSGDYYYTSGGGYDTIGVSIHNYYPPYFAKVNKNGGVVWRKFIETYYEQISPYYIKEYNGNLYMVGFTIDTALNGGNAVSIFAKFDSLGNLKWTQRYYKFTHTYADNYLSDFVQTKDGGFMLCGSSWDTLNNINVQCTWIVRVDSNGCQMANCIVKDTVGSGITPSPLERVGVRLYPNPANEQLNIVSSLVNIQQITITNIVGANIDCAINVDGKNAKLGISQLASGMYIVKVIDTNGGTTNIKFEVAH
jgi:Secretion system C-terminal sorting domain